MNPEREEARVSQGGEGRLRRLTFAEMAERDRVKAAGTPAALLARAEKAEAERDDYKARVEELENALGEITETYTLNEPPGAGSNQLRQIAAAALSTPHRG